MNDLGRLKPVRRSGAEPFHIEGAPTGFDLLDFWRWSGSDLITNTTRGLLAEYIVARALGIAMNGVRDPWAPFDLTTTSGVKVEVKSGSYLQSWYQRRLTDVCFTVKPSRAWSAETNQLEADQHRQADVYVFALLSHQSKSTLDPLNVAHWEFYVLATQVLDERTRSQQSIMLGSLKRLDAGPFAFGDLAEAVARAGAHPRPSTLR